MIHHGGYTMQDVQKGRPLTPAHSERAKTRSFPGRGRSEREGEAYPLGYVEPLSDARTKPGQNRVTARPGWAGAMVAFFNILP